MPEIAFTPNLQRHIACPATNAPGSTVREVLEHVFVENPRLRGYVLDDQGAVRRHMLIFVDGLPLQDRAALLDAVRRDTKIFVMQGLSGG